MFTNLAKTANELGPHPVGNLKIWVFWKIWEKKTPVFSYCAWKFGHSTIDVWGIFQADHRWVDWVEWFGTRTFVCLCEVWVLEIVSTRWFWKFNTLRTGKSTHFEVRCLPSISIRAMASSSQTVKVKSMENCLCCAAGPRISPCPLDFANYTQFSGRVMARIGATLPNWPELFRWMVIFMHLSILYPSYPVLFYSNSSLDYSISRSLKNWIISNLHFWCLQKYLPDGLKNGWKIDVTSRSTPIQLML